MIESKRFSAILLFGPPGSGKGTLGEQLAQKGGHVHLSSGDVFRSLDPESKIGKVFRSYAEKGKLVPDEVTIEIFEEHVLNLVKNKSYDPRNQLLMLDGLPRTRKQAEVLDRDINVKAIVVLDIADKQVLIDRILGRAKDQGRQDDQSEDVLNQRFKVYESQTRDVLKHYDNELVYHIDAMRSKQDVLQDVLNQLKSIL